MLHCRVAVARRRWRPRRPRSTRHLFASPSGSAGTDRTVPARGGQQEEASSAACRTAGFFFVSRQQGRDVVVSLDAHSARRVSTITFLSLVSLGSAFLVRLQRQRKAKAIANPLANPFPHLLYSQSCTGRDSAVLYSTTVPTVPLVE